MFYNCTKFQNNPRGSVEKHRLYFSLALGYGYACRFSLFTKFPCGLG